MRRWAVALGLLMLAGGVQSVTAQPSGTGVLVADVARAATISRVSRSVVRVKVVDKALSPAFTPPPSTRRKRGPQHEAAQAFEKLFGWRASEPTRDEGTGFVFDAARGLVLTPAHIVDQAKTITVALPDGSERPATRVGMDEDSGIALLRVEGMTLPALSFSPRQSVAGDTALVVGYLIPTGSVAALSGMVTGTVDGGALPGAVAPPLGAYVGVDAVLPNGGFGGSPVIGADGGVIGFVHALYGRTVGVDTLTLMVPASVLRPVALELATSGVVRRSVIGIQHSCEGGLCSIEVAQPGGPAAVAGLRAGDRIRAVGGARVFNGGAVARAIAAAAIGAELPIEVERDGRVATVRVRTVDAAALAAVPAPTLTLPTQ